MPDNQQPISYYVEEAKRLGLTEEQISVIGDETDGQSFREHIANAHDKTDDELRDLLSREWSAYSADHSGEDGEGFDHAAQAEDEANGRHAASAEAAGELDDADELDDEDDDFATDEEDEEADWDEEDDEDSSDADDGESSDEPEEDHDSGEEGVHGPRGPDDSALATDVDSLDHLDFDEEAIERKRDGGGEALDDGEADCEGCKI